MINLASPLQSSPKRIAVLAPVATGYHGEIVRGFMRSSNSTQLKVDTFYSRNLNDRNIRLYVEGIIADGYDLLVTVGLKCTRVAQNVTHEMHSSLPIIFVGITDPVEQGMIKSVENPGSNMTGIMYSFFQTSRALEFLHSCKQDALKEILIVFENSPQNSADQESEKDQQWVDEEIVIVEKFGSENNIATSSFGGSTPEELLSFIKQRKTAFDTIMLLEGTISLDTHRELAEWCNQNGITLFSGLTEAVRFGSALGYGVDFSPLGTKAYEFAMQILFSGKQPAEMPCHRVEHKRTGLANLALSARQGLDRKHVEEVCNNTDAIIIERAGVDV